MIIRDLAVALGLDVNAASFAEGEAFIEVVKAGLDAIVSTASDVAGAFVEVVGESKQLNALGALFGRSASKGLRDYAAGVDAAVSIAQEGIDGTVKRMEKALQQAKTAHDYVFGYIRLGWAKLAQLIAPALLEIAGFLVKNALFLRDVFVQVFAFLQKNWQTVKFALIWGATAIAISFALIRFEAIKAAAATAAAWLAAAWPFILIGGLIAGLLLALDDVRVYLQGGDSLFGRWKKQIEGWLSIKADDPPWLKSIKSFLGNIKEALTKQGAIEGFFARIKQFFLDIWESLKSIDWTPFYRVFQWVAERVMDVDWKAWALRIKAAVGLVADVVRSVDWSSWGLALKGIGLRLWQGYLMIRGMVRAAGELVDTLRGVPSRVLSFGARLAGVPEAPAAATPGAPAALPGGPPAFQLPTYGGEGAPAYRGPLRAPPAMNVTRAGDTFHITQLPGEDSEALARRIAEIRTTENEDAAAAIPATE